MAAADVVCVGHGTVLAGLIAGLSGGTTSLMAVVAQLAALFSVPADNPDLARSQLRAMSNQIPLLYCLLVINSIALSATHLDTAPALLTVYLPGGLMVACLFRLVWWRASIRRPISDLVVVRRLRVTLWLVALLGVGFTIWALSLFPYGDAYAQGHVAFYMAITVIGCIFCLMHLRPAALVLTIVVVVPFAVFFVATGNPVFRALALDLVLVTAVMIVILLTYYRDFAHLIESRKAVQAKQAETQRLSDENFRLANLDPLTELPNRRRFFADLDALLQEAEASGERFAVGMIDLDGFKPVNDIYGHAAGDRVLIEAGRRLAQICGGSMALARLGGDEFGLLVRGSPEGMQLLDFGRSVCRVLQVPYVTPDFSVDLSGSLGFALYPDAGRSAAQLFERADYALYHAKDHRRGGTVLFTTEHETEILAANRIEQALRHADLEAEMSVHFQPIVDVVEERIVGFEALVRWTNAGMGAVSPAAFIKVAERSELINHLTEILLRKALTVAAGWPPGIGLSFNLSARDVVNSEMVPRLTEIILMSGVDPHRIDFEITETALMRDFGQACENLQAFRRLGVKVALDDFGTGYSSLSYVHRLPLDKIKIDRSFIAEIATAPASRAVVKTILDLCRNLGIDCVIEGTETAAELAILRDLGCRTCQGYLFGRPASAEAARARLKAPALVG